MGFTHFISERHRNGDKDAFGGKVSAVHPRPSSAAPAACPAGMVQDTKGCSHSPVGKLILPTANSKCGLNTSHPETRFFFPWGITCFSQPSLPLKLRVRTATCQRTQVGAEKAKRVSRLMGFLPFHVIVCIHLDKQQLYSHYYSEPYCCHAETLLCGRSSSPR